ncbi:MAG TPA: hypothetical protein VNJ07_11280 [Chitinophagales bacterium]|nr:hypothetical protein [Chitinophagales bacterium]
MPEMLPYVSFVIAGRNDDYGGDFNERLSNSIIQLAHLAEKFRLPAEYVIVNYNPIAEKKPLSEAICWPQNRKHLRIRIITVSNAVHRQNENPQIRKPLPFYEYVAKNAGIRRAKGEYICAANPDIIFHPEIIRWLSKKPLKKNCYYRTDRCDFKKPATPPPPDPADYMEWLKPRIYRTFLKGNHYDTQLPLGLTLPVLRIYNCGLLKLELLFSRYPALGNAFCWEINFHNAEYRYHCNVSGDFMLMHRDHWHHLHGYPENTYIALHTDALFVVAAGISGLKEHVLRWPLFHQDHQRRYDAQKDEFSPVLRQAYLFFQDEAQKMIAEKKTKIYNPDNWGLADFRLEETEF